MMVRLFCSPVTQVKFLLRAASLASEVGSEPVMRLSSVLIRVTATSERLAGISSSFLLLRMDTRTDGQAQVRRPGSALSWAVRGQRRGLGSQTHRGLDESAAPVYSWLLPAHDRCKNVRAGPTAPRKMCLSLHPETGKVVMELSQCLNADTPSGSDSCAPVSVSPLTIANQDGWTQKLASAK